MKRLDAPIINQLGLHARAASKLVSTASRFESDVWVEKSGKRINAKSIMGVLMLAAAKGSVITIETSGSDEDDAIQALQELIADRFGEDQ